MFVTDTLGNPYAEQEWLPAIFGPIAESRRQANKIKRQEPITVVIGNPPYKEKAKGRGGWVENGSANSPSLRRSQHGCRRASGVWVPTQSTCEICTCTSGAGRLGRCSTTTLPPTPGSSASSRWLAFSTGPASRRCAIISVEPPNEIWVIDCSPEGHQPVSNTRIFEGVQQPVCIVLASRSPDTNQEAPATVRFRALPRGHRQAKFEALGSLTLDSDGWIECPSRWRAPFLPESVGAWGTFPAIDDLFDYNGSGVMPGRTWIVAPDKESLRRRWQKLIDVPDDQKEALFHPHLRGGEPGDKHSKRVVKKGLPGYEPRPTPVADDQSPFVPPTRYGFRSFDRQWIIPDNRLINQPNPELWKSRSEQQVYLTVLTRTSPSKGPALTFTGLIPDLDHYNGRGGRVFPLWRDRNATVPNIPPNLLAYLGKRYQRPVSAEDLMAYVAAVAAHPAFTTRFKPDLAQPGLRIPFTGDSETFATAAELGRTVIWLHTFGERFADSSHGRPPGPPRLAPDDAPRIPTAGAIPNDPADMPDTLAYDESKRRLSVGHGYVENVDIRVWNYEISGKNVLHQWFSYRRANRERPIIGDRRKPSKLGEIQPDHWPAEYTTELINVLNVLGRLVDLEPSQADLLERICSSQMISADELHSTGALTVDADSTRRGTTSDPSEQASLLG